MKTIKMIVISMVFITGILFVYNSYAQGIGYDIADKSDQNSIEYFYDVQTGDILDVNGQIVGKILLQNEDSIKEDMQVKIKTVNGDPEQERYRRAQEAYRREQEEYRRALEDLKRRGYDQKVYRRKLEEYRRQQEAYERAFKEYERAHKEYRRELEKGFKPRGSDQKMCRNPYYGKKIVPGSASLTEYIPCSSLPAPWAPTPPHFDPVGGTPNKSADPNNYK